jgi:hypothetical protein
MNNTPREDFWEWMNTCPVTWSHKETWGGVAVSFIVGEDDEDDEAIA